MFKINMHAFKLSFTNFSELLIGSLTDLTQPLSGPKIWGARLAKKWEA
jgi:hypothetical protein